MVIESIHLPELGTYIYNLPADAQNDMVGMECPEDIEIIF